MSDKQHISSYTKEVHGVNNLQFYKHLILKKKMYQLNNFINLTSSYQKGHRLVVLESFCSVFYGLALGEMQDYRGI